MKSSSALQIKSWTTKIHPPLYRTPRESQQLLSALTTSFRRHLDAQFPPKHDDLHLQKHFNKGQDARTKATIPSSTVSTDHHFQFILKHPLFQSVPRPPSIERRNDIAESIRLLRDPMNYFDRKVSSGFATPKTVELCLQAQKNTSLSSSDIDTRTSMRNSGAGIRAARWFATTSDENRAAFLRNQNAVDLAAAFLLVENRRDDLWQWIFATEDFSLVDKSGLARMQANAMIAFMKAEIQVGQGISGALDIYLEASRRSVVPTFTINYVQKLASSENFDLGKCSPLSVAGRFLASSILHWERKSDETVFMAEQFEAFLRVFGVWCRSAGIHGAHLLLRHPTHPDPSLALPYIKKISLSQDGPLLGTSQWKYRLSLCLETAQVLLAQQKHADANFVLDVVNEKFFQERGIGQLANRAGNKAQDVVNAAMLERLDMGYS